MVLLPQLWALGENIHMLYKYFPEYRLKELQNLTIRFSPLRSLNDPFESQPLFNLSDRFAAVTDEAIKEFHAETVYDDDGNIVTLEQFKVHLEKARVELGLLPSSAGIQLISKIGDSFGVLCLSRTKSSLLMWCHYANEGKGYLVAFDEKHEFFHRKAPNGLPTGPIPISYSTERPVVQLDDTNYYEKLFCSKPLEWSYEEEERIFCRYSEDVPVEQKLDYFGQKVRFSQLPRETIKAVYLGYNSDIDLKNKIISAINKNKIDCVLFQGYTSDSEYRVVFEEIST